LFLFIYLFHDFFTALSWLLWACAVVISKVVAHDNFFTHKQTLIFASTMVFSSFDWILIKSQSNVETLFRQSENK